MPIRFAAVATLLFAVAAAGEELSVKDAVVSFSKTANPHPVSGFGAEWDPHFWKTQNTRRGCDEKAWETVLERIREIGISRVRMMLLPDWYEPNNDNADPAQTDQKAFTWDSDMMQSLYRQLDYCQKAGIRVNITWWCAPVKRQSDGAPYWMAYPNVKDWCSAPNDVAECAENVVAGLHHLIDVRGYSCIDEFTFMNEPDWTFFNNENKVDFEYYATICRAIDARLKEAGLRSRVRLDLADDSQHKGWLKKSADALGVVADCYNAHSYIFSCQDADYPTAMRTWARGYVKQCGDKPFSVNELGTRHYQGAYTATDVETFERAFCVSQLAILGLNEGMTGALFWGLYDQYYYDGPNPDDGSNGGLMKTNLMAYVTEGWRLRPSGQAWTLICHGAPRDAQVHPGKSNAPGIDAVALVAPGAGGTNILLVNRTAAPCTVRLENLPLGPNARVSRIRSFGRAGLAELETTALKESSALATPAETVLLVSFGAAR
jgi:alpha-galactosidase